MTTDDLITSLSRNTEPVRTSTITAKIAIGLITGLILAVLLVKATLGFRSHIDEFAHWVALKVVFSSLMAVFVCALMLHLVKPAIWNEHSVRQSVWRVGAIVVASLGVGGLALALAPAGGHMAALTGNKIPWCVALIPFFGLPTAACLIWIVRDGAPTRLAGAGGAIGGVSGAIGAIAYALACPIDSAAFVTIWYMAGIGVAGLLGSWLLRHLIRW